jgi:capsular exopolysaccharide synthesis family protein
MNNYLVRNETSRLPETTSANPIAAFHPVNAHLSAERGAAIHEILSVLHKRKTFIILCSLCCLGIAAYLTFSSKPRYRSTATVQVNKDSADLLGLDDLRGRRAEEGMLNFVVTLETHAQALQSDALAIRVARELNLESRREFRAPQFWSDYFMKFPDESTLPLEKAPHRRAELLRAFHKYLKVNTQPGTRLMQIQFNSPDPAIAASVANRLVNDYVEQTFQLRYAATKQSSDWLAGQLAELKNQEEISQQRMVDYAKQAGILGTDESHNVVMTKLEDVSKQLTEAQANRILAQAVWQLSKSGNPELVSGLVGNSTTMTSPSTMTMTLTLIQSLRSQEALLKADYAQASTKYGSAYPRLIQMQNQINNLDASIKTQVDNLAIRAENDYQESLQTEKNLRGTFEQAKAEANNMNDSAVQYTIMKHEAESSRDLYDGLLKKFKEAGVLANLHSTDILLLDPAAPTDRPARPIVPLNLAIGLLGGLALGVAGAFFRENFDQTIDTVDQVEHAAMAPSLAIVPKWKALKSRQLKPANALAPAKDSILMLAEPQSQSAEAFRTLRACVSHVDPSVKPRVLMVTSALQEEGKTTTSLNYAVALAQQGKRVLLVEADLRRPTLKSRLHLNTASGLSSMLGGAPATDLPVAIPSIPKLFVIPAGPESSTAPEMLSSLSMAQMFLKWRTEYDYVVVDTPPVLSVSDALTLSDYCDATILVVRAGVTTTRTVARVRHELAQTRTGITGVVINAIDIKSPEYRPYYGRRRAS